MFISAIVIGLATAYYFGFRAGGIAAAVSVVLFFLALFMPTKALLIYGLVGVGFFSILTLGPRYGRPGAKADFLRLARRLIAKIWRRTR